MICMCGSLYYDNYEGDIQLCQNCLKVMQKYNEAWLKELNERIGNLLKK